MGHIAVALLIGLSVPHKIKTISVATESLANVSGRISQAGLVFLWRMHLQ